MAIATMLEQIADETPEPARGKLIAIVELLDQWAGTWAGVTEIQASTGFGGGYEVTGSKEPRNVT